MDTLFEWGATHARNSDPRTSHEAARKAQPSANRHVRAIVTFLQNIHPRGAAADVIAAETKLERHVVLKRLSDAERAGLAIPTGETRLMNTRRKGRVWMATHGTV